MQRNRFLGGLLSQLFDRRGTLRGREDARDIFELCDALLSAEGKVSGLRLASSILSLYADLSREEKLAFFQYINTQLEFNSEEVARLAADYEASPSLDAYKAFTQAAEPKRQELLRRLNQPVGATAELVAMRVDLLKFLKDDPDLSRTDLDFVHLLRSWFNHGFLVLQQINWDTPARILDKIVAYEAVHQINDWDDLRRRLYPPDRRCFAFFHPSMPEEPLIFVEVALTETVPGSVDVVLSEGRTPLEAHETKVAVFYSISNCQKGLTGISFGNLLIKQVVAELSLEIPELEQFVTLSPIPGLNRWLDTQVADAAIGDVAHSVLTHRAEPEDVRAMAASYLLGAKRGDGMPLDPVARFHLGNGAEIHDIHADADTSQNGLIQSSGAMVNYLYDLRRTERNHEDFAMNGSVTASKAVLALASDYISLDSKKEAS